ncbi:hypothetical protein E4U57_000075 [Claviceps arundinis]|uniref:Pathogenesis-related protein NtPRp27 n=1 Tax=Claviceps arundinis TaxID=1623583 RepID=A0ABQ7PNS1_9HYPO|nr:hypothetical protein E4U57_000075 [Claviceps arundinis]
MSPAVQIASSSNTSDKHHDASLFPLPKLRLKVKDLGHPGASLFFSSIQPTKTLTRAATNVLRLLYHDPSDPSTTPPPTRSVTLIIRDMSGVAYTMGTDLDNDHKEIHLALSHITDTDRALTCSEITGVLTHELVHCLQWNAQNTCPGGLIEGIADWVRLRCDLAPPHWKKVVPEKWDAGYQHTAYFLDYLEHRFGSGFVRRLNEKLRVDKYDEKTFWPELTCGTTVGDLFKEYVAHLKKEGA